MKQVLFLLLFSLTMLKLEAQEVTFLKLKQAFKYEDNNNVPEFSGLSIKDGSLYSVNDKREDYLYKLEVDTSNATFRARGTCISEGIDFEGLCYFDSAFYAVDERNCKVYKVVDNKAVEFSKEFLSSLDSQKLIDTGEKGNMQIESFAMIDDSTFLIATERGITTIAKINVQGKILSKKLIPPLHYNDAYLPVPLTKQSAVIKDANSFSDLCIFDDKAYLLERKKKMIYVVDFSNDSYNLIKTLSFKDAIEPCEEYHDYYGAAEELAIDSTYIYIILDNNARSEKERKQMCDESRKTLFQFYKDGY